ncbi:MAG: hypothetical protein JO187_01975 [Acidobacteria bacterium]|nr:hypothetical protein [Acidobacteriota bacterium]
MASAVTLRGCAQQLRTELSARNQEYARVRNIEAHLSRGEPPVVLYAPAENGRAHGNFHPDSYRAILAHPEWRKRLDKRHAQAREALARNLRPHWNELDSSCSSDALLMNIFCHPHTVREPRVWALLGEEAGEPQFGFKARVPLVGGRTDRTEIDMRVGNLLVEAKLTESDFQRRSCEILDSYRDFADVFDTRMLPRRESEFCGYQLIRNVLAAHALECSFCVLLDARRPGLLEHWYAVMRSVKAADLRTRMKVLTWQELALVLPHHVQTFLNCKYGIVPSGAGC